MASALRSTVSPSSARRSRADGVASSQSPGREMRASTSTRCAARGGSGAPDAILMRNASTRTPASTSTPPAAAGATSSCPRTPNAMCVGAAVPAAPPASAAERVRHALERALAEQAADRDRGKPPVTCARAVGAREALERVAQRDRGSSARAGLPAVEQVGQVRHRVGERPLLAGALQHEPRGAQRLGGVRRGDDAQRRPAVRCPERDQAGDQRRVRRGERARGQAGRRVRDEDHGATAAQFPDPRDDGGDLRGDRVERRRRGRPGRRCSGRPGR